MDTNLQYNPKNKLLELLAKFMGSSAPAPVYECTPTNSGFHCKLTVTLTVKEITQSWYSCSVTHFSKKKEAEISAAAEIDIDGIRTFLSEKGSIFNKHFLYHE